MPSQAMQDAIETLRDRQRASAGQVPPTVAELRAGFVPGDRLHPVPDDVLVEEVIAGGVPAHWLTAPGTDPGRVLLFLHGGGWRMGNKRDIRSWIQFLANEGYVAVSVGYRLAPDAVFPAQIEDAKTAVRFLRAHADKYHIDKDRIGAMGWSAGGHLACLLGLTDPKAGLEGTECPKESSRVLAVVDYFGPTDLAGFAKDDTAQRGMLGPFIGSKFADNPAARRGRSGNGGQYHQRTPAAVPVSRSGPRHPGSPGVPGAVALRADPVPVLGMTGQYRTTER